MRPLTFTVYDRIPSYTDVVSPDTYRYNPERGWAWLQRLCFRFLRWIDCRAVDKTVSHETVTVDQTIPDTALDQITRIKRRGGEPDFILTGPAEWNDIQCSSPLQFEAQYGYRRERTLYGVRVRVLPEFKGLVVVPKE